MRDIRAMVRGVKPRARLSAAVGPSPSEAKRKHFQDSRRWLAEGLLDAVYPMNYSGDMRIFTKRLYEWSAMRLRIPVVVGVMFDQRSASTVVAQIQRARKYTAHFSAFAYNSLFERRMRTAGHRRDRDSPARAALRKRVIPYLRRLTLQRV